MRQRTWNREICDFVDERVLSMLPPLGSSQDVHGAIRPELAKKWGLGDNVIVSAHTTDVVPALINTAQTDLFCENLRRYLAGEELLNVLDQRLLY